MPPRQQRSSPVRIRHASALKIQAAAGSAFRSIALTMILSFIVSFAYLFWKQKSSEVSAPLPPLAVHSTAAPPRPAAALEPPPSPVRSVEPMRSGAVVRQPPESADAGEATGDEQQPDLVPITMFVRTLRGEGRIEGQIKSLSSNPLTVTIAASNRQGDETAQITLQLDPLQPKTFGTDEGMDLQSGGRLVVRSPGYRDRDAAVP